MRTLQVAVLLPVIALLWGAAPAQKLPVDQWPNYQHNSNFSPLTQITPANVTQLTNAWTFHYGAGSKPSGNLELDYRFELQPLIVGGVMYISTPALREDSEFKSTISAIEPETGKLLWKYISPRHIHERGIAYWPGTNGMGPRVFFATDQGFLMGLDLRTHELARGFGDNGQVDVYVGVASERVGESRRSTFTIPNPVTVYKNLLISGARPGEGLPPQPRGDIRAWDAITGKPVWSFHTIPQPGEPNHEDWTGDDWVDRSGGNVWSTFAVDDQRGLVFAPTGDANHAVAGKNLYSNSLLALDANTGKLKWFHQLIHHDIWDFDLPTPPLLVDVHRDGRVIPAVVQTGKMGLMYIFDRVTGEPLYGMEERPVNRGDDPKNEVWPTQPFPLKPAPIAHGGMTRADINKMTPEIEKFCTDFWDANHLQPSKTFDRPKSTDAMMTGPGSIGGPNWGPLSYNPDLGLAFISLQDGLSYHAAGVPSPALPDVRYGGGGGGAAPARGAAGDRGGGAPAAPARGVAGDRGGGAGPGRGAPAASGGRGGGYSSAFVYRLPSGASVPCYAPPYGAVVAVDVNTGEIAWRSALGVNESLAELGDMGLNTGTHSLGGSIATAGGLVFIGAAADQRFRAFDAKTGKELWVARLPASGHATPVTYMGKDGMQYVVIPAAGGTVEGRNQPVSDSLVAFRLPR